MGGVRITAEIAVEGARKVGLSPREPYPGHTKAYWRLACACGALLEKVNYNKIKRGLRENRPVTCFPCGRELSGDRQRYSQDEARARMILCGAMPLDPYVGSGEPWRCRCLNLKCGREISPSLSSAQSQGPCVYCGGNRSDLDEVYARMDAAGLRPLEDFPGVDEPWLCECLVCGRQPTPRYATIKWNGGGCKYCAERAVDPEEAGQIMRDAGLEPLKPYPGGNKKEWECRCQTCGNTVYPRYNTIHQGLGHGCESCGKARGGLKRRIPEADAVAYMLAGGFTPLAKYPGAMRPWRSRCSCGAVRSPSLHNVKSRATGVEGCRECRPPYDPDVPGSVYLVYSAKFNAIKVGIMKTSSNRLEQHRREGWRPIQHHGVTCVWQVETVRHAYMIEQRVLAWWRDDLEALPAVRFVDMPQGGASETAYTSDVDLHDTVLVIMALVEDSPALVI